jgi:hypothetical protein
LQHVGRHGTHHFSIHIEFPGRALISVERVLMVRCCDRFWRVCASDSTSCRNKDLDRSGHPGYPPKNRSSLNRLRAL